MAQEEQPAFPLGPSGASRYRGVTGLPIGYTFVPGALLLPTTIPFSDVAFPFDAEDPFDSRNFVNYKRSFQVFDDVDKPCGANLDVPLTRAFAHVMVLIENEGACDVTVELFPPEGLKNMKLPTATQRVGRKIEGRVSHKATIKCDEGISRIRFDCSGSDATGNCKFSYKIRAF